MQVPLIVSAAVGGLLVESHGIGESGLKQIVVTNGDAAQDVAEEIVLLRAELIDRSDVALAQDERFERPYGPERHDDGKSIVLANDPRVQLQFQLQVVAQQAGMFFGVILPEGRQLPSGQVWQRGIRPN